MKYWNKSWNPIVGCRRISTGCENCWAEKTAWRMAWNPITQDKYTGIVSHRKWTGVAKFDRSVLSLPLSWTKPNIVATCWMGDMFSSAVENEWIDELFWVMRNADKQTFLVLTKRSVRTAIYASLNKIPPNVWIGVSVENQQHINRIPLGSPAHRWVSVEPMLGPVNLQPYLNRIDWVVAGAETGPKARSCEDEWLISLRDQCKEANVPFLCKSNPLISEQYPWKYSIDIIGETIN